MAGKFKAPLKVGEVEKMLQLMAERWPDKCILKCYGRGKLALVQAKEEAKAVTEKLYNIPNFRAIEE